MIKESKRKEDMIVYESIMNVLQKTGIENVLQEDLTDAIDHGTLVSRIAMLLCEQMGLDEQETRSVFTAAALHDIGKLKLSRYLYGRNKSALQIEEVKYMRMHAEISYEILKECGYSADILEAVYHHHENYDGSGYPGNLREQMIPHSARILKVCDVFAALISERPYRSAFDMDTAVELMIEDAKDYDIGIFLEFLKLYHSPKFKEVELYAASMNGKQRYLHGA